MGNCFGTEAASSDASAAAASSYYAAPSPRAVSSGGRLGGDAVVAQVGPRAAAAMAAEARAAAQKPREDRLKREDLVGKLLEAHRRRGLSPPLNLASLPLPQLVAMNEQLGLRGRVA